ncbi:HU family DNA-binding protein [Hyphococcus sp.]|uniref:HU family DNA-binding protein n=1 Tax=Hyphococcus sp. TaxID=2038636 RepID=UPI0035C70B60
MPDVLTLKHLAAELAEAYEMPKKQAEEIVSDFIDRMGGYLKKGKKLRISGLGILQVRHRAARMGRNPATGEAIKIKASKKVAFRPSKDLKERVL